MHFSSLLVYACGIASVLCDVSISSFPNSLTLAASFNPIKEAYWTGLPHHRRTPFAISPDGKSAYIAYLDSTLANVHVQQVDVTTFAAVGSAVSVAAFEAAGLVAQNDGFALMATVKPTGSTDIPPNSYTVVALIRFKNGVEAWRTMLNGPGVHAADGLTATPDANGDLVYSPVSGLYAAYFVVTAYTGYASGHFGDSIQYVNDSGSLQNIESSSVFGCSHNTGIGLEEADAPPFASICAEDHGAIWLNTDTRYMSGVKIANENVTNGASGEPMGGMSGSYSNLARFPSTSSYIFAWQSRGAVDLTLDDWMGAPYTQSKPRWLNHNVAIATLASKNTLTGSQASSVVGAADGDSQVNWITESSTEDHQNVHVAAINSKTSIVTYETLTSPHCEAVPLGCTGTYAGTSFQLVDSAGAKIGSPVVSKSVFVSGDIANVGTDRVCWPYVETTWDLSAPKSSGTLVSKMSFACAGLDGSAAVTSSLAQAGTSSPAPTAQTTAPAAEITSLIADAIISSVSILEVSTTADVEVIQTTPVATETPKLVSANPTLVAPTDSATPEETPSASISTDDPVQPVETQTVDPIAASSKTAAISSLSPSSRTGSKPPSHTNFSHRRPKHSRHGHAKPTTMSRVVKAH